MFFKYEIYIVKQPIFKLKIIKSIIKIKHICNIKNSYNISCNCAFLVFFFFKYV